jgi:hypothetical protein
MADLRILNQGTNAYKNRFGSTPAEAANNFIKDGYVPIRHNDYEALAKLDTRANPKETKNTQKPLIRIIYNEANENKILAGGRFLYLVYKPDNRINVTTQGYNNQRPEYMRVKPLAGGHENISIQMNKVATIFVKWPPPEDGIRTVSGGGLNINVTRQLYKTLTNNA